MVTIVSDFPIIYLVLNHTKLTMQKVVVILFCVIFYLSCKKDHEPPDPRAGLDLPNDVSFTHLPTDLNRMHSFGPIGAVFVIPKGHGGFGPKDYYLAKLDIPVYAMADGIIYNIRYGTQPYEDFVAVDSLVGTEYEDFALHIYLTKTAEMHYGHVSALAPEIWELAGNLVKGSIENRVSISIKAGQIVGYIGVHPGFDVGLSDTKKEHWFANPDRYDVHYRSFIPFTDYLLPKLREEVWRINPRVVEPRGGKINYDVEGALAGNWFLEGTTNDENFWSRQLIIAYHELYADKITISETSPLADGPNDPSERPNLWWIFGNAPAPENVTQASGIIKLKVAHWNDFYLTENPPPDGTILIEMIAPDKLKYEFFKEKLPIEVEDFTEDAKVYER